MKLWSWKKENIPSVSHAFRTAFAATLSVLVARLVETPEPYWSAIATIVVMQSKRVVGNDDYLAGWVRILQAAFASSARLRRCAFYR